jgi:hypothetical protein
MPHFTYNGSDLNTPGWRTGSLLLDFPRANRIPEPALLPGPAVPSGLTSAHDRQGSYNAVTEVGSKNVGRFGQRKDHKKYIKEHHANDPLYHHKVFIATIILNKYL